MPSSSVTMPWAGFRFFWPHGTCHRKGNFYSFPFTPADEFLASPNIYSVLTLQIIKSDPVPTSNLTVSPAQTMFYTLVFSARCIMLRSGNISCPCLPHSFLVGVICCRPTLPCDFLPFGERYLISRCSHRSHCCPLCLGAWEEGRTLWLECGDGVVFMVMTQAREKASLGLIV